jgi:hypothetical protein
MLLGTPTGSGQRPVPPEERLCHYNFTCSKRKLFSDAALAVTIPQHAYKNW